MRIEARMYVSIEVCARTFALISVSVNYFLPALYVQACNELPESFEETLPGIIS